MPTVSVLGTKGYFTDMACKWAPFSAPKGADGKKQWDQKERNGSRSQNFTVHKYGMLQNSQIKLTGLRLKITFFTMFHSHHGRNA